MGSLQYTRVLFTGKTISLGHMVCLAHSFGSTRPLSYLYKPLVNSAYQIFGERLQQRCYSSPSKTKKKRQEVKLPDVEGMNRQFNDFRDEISKKLVIAGKPSKYTTRSHTCGELTADNVGHEVTLCGWLTFKRLNGMFMVLRDLYGVTQLYVPKELTDAVQIADDAPLESVLRITGEVVLRPEGQRRKDQVSGDVEVVVKTIELLNKPIETRLAYNDLEKIEEDLCIQYRYLYLRNAKAQMRLRKRAAFLSSVRQFMDANQFIDIETPTLIRRTPGGAREFPVLTKFKDAYYALAQSPQLLKQLLMAGGMDKYYQIARCYRDETGRPDRQPEFTQLDIEMSFTTRDGVMSLVEDLMKHACPKDIIPNVNEPFPRMTYQECMDKYRSDKPDTGGFLWVVDFPLFLPNKNSGELEAAHHPFTMPKDITEVYDNPENAIGLSYDLVYCGAEIGGGSIRIHDANLQKYVFKDVLNLPLSDIDYLLDALQSGCPPHGGFALGIDRFMCKLMSTNSIRDVIAFPKSSEGKDLLSGAPSPLDAESLKFYGKR